MAVPLIDVPVDVLVTVATIVYPKDVGILRRRPYCHRAFTRFEMRDDAPCFHGARRKPLIDHPLRNHNLCFSERGVDCVRELDVEVAQAADVVGGERGPQAAVADVDLYIPILKYVFGEAQVGGPCALVSAHRLHQEFYGLARDTELLQQRLLKECVHELGHTFGLHHCQDYRCAMASSHAVEWIDLRASFLCNECRLQVDASGCFVTAAQHKISAS